MQAAALCALREAEEKLCVCVGGMQPSALLGPYVLCNNDYFIIKLF